MTSASRDAAADDFLNPFGEPPTFDRPATRAAKSSETGGEALPSGPLDIEGAAVERAELAPIMATDGSGLPYELWRGLTVTQVEEQIASLQIPPRSPALHGLWRRLITSDVPPPSGSEGSARFTAIRAEALDRSGLLDEAAALLAKETAGQRDPLLATLAARTAIGLGDRQNGCEIAKGIAGSAARMPEPLKATALLLAGYCAAAEGDRAAADLNADLAREIASSPSFGADALSAVANGSLPDLGAVKTLSLIDYRILELKGGLDPSFIKAHGTPGLLAALARAPSTEPGLKLAGGEAAAAANAITAAELAAIYRAAAAGQPPSAASLAPETGGADPALRRALLFHACETERTPLKKARLIRSFIDDARHSGLYWTALALMAAPSDDLAPAPEIGWFAETAIETNIAAGKFTEARAWANAGAPVGPTGEREPLTHWLALADIADPGMTGERSANLAVIEHMTHDGRFDPALLQRLAAVLDALDINVPIPLWDAANRALQPAGGRLPDTGVLSELLDASKKKEFGRTVLLAMRTLGADGAEGANVIALGDSIRALRRAGLDAEARELGLEALFVGWPRTVSN